jgi:hypothetical protein
MKRTIQASLLSLLIFAVLPAYAAQEQHTVSQSEKVSKKSISISGKVGAEGKTLISDRGNRVWQVLNPELLTTSEGHRVTVRARANSEASEITITVVRLMDERTTPKLDDVAFRR